MFTEIPLTKIKIEAYTDKELSAKCGEFSLPVNPETYKRSYKVELDDRRPHGECGSDPKFTSSPPEELNLEFLFDETGTIEGYAGTTGNGGVKKDIETFIETVYKVDGSIHRPKFLKVKWGNLEFPCVLANVDIQYTLFNGDGVPIRAKANAMFKEYLSPEVRQKGCNKNSPDLTHRVTIQSSDRLDNLVYDVYKDPQYMLQVAQINNFTSLRQMPLGQELVLPPLDKTEL